jgi:hypothetical protein
MIVVGIATYLGSVLLLNGCVRDQEECIYAVKQRWAQYIVWTVLITH